MCTQVIASIFLFLKFLTLTDRFVFQLKCTEYHIFKKTHTHWKLFTMIFTFLVLKHLKHH